MGFIVGGIFGGLMGTYYAVVSRSVLYIPTAAIASGCSFGYFMGIGMVMRTEMEANDKGTEECQIIQIDMETGKRTQIPMYHKYIV
jgi:hypothetical protein